MKIQGTNLLLSWEDAYGNTDVFSYGRSCEVSQKSDSIEVASPASARAKTFLPGRTSWNITCECLLSSDESRIEAIYRSGEEISVRCWQKGAIGGYYYKGRAFISTLRTTGRLHDMAAYTIGLQGTGELEYTKDSTGPGEPGLPESDPLDV